MRISNKNKGIGMILVFIVLLSWIGMGVVFMRIEEVDNNIGQTIVIKQDTLMILGFNNRTMNYILDDGREVNKEIVKLFKIETND